MSTALAAHRSRAATVAGGGYEAAVSVYGRDFGPWLVEALTRVMSEAAP